MCGIFFTNIETPNIDAFMRQRHRGPDQSVYIQTNGFTYGFHHLAITTTTQTIQPFQSYSFKVLCNGEIYNWKALTKQYELPVESDCEIIGYLYSLLGFENMINKLDGEFAIVIHDFEQHKVYVARDFMGIRPLYYYCNDSDDQLQLAIASELKSIEQYGKIHHIEPRKLYEFNLKTKLVRDNSYWHFPAIGREIVHYPHKLFTQLHQLIKESVRDRLESRRPIGCLLSGGVDSSLIVALASRIIPNLQCFTIGAETSPDVQAARQVAHYLGVRLTVVDFSVEEGIASIIPVIYHLETYDITTIRASIPQFLLAKWIRTHTDIKVILSGEGSDELFSGYAYSKQAPNSKKLYQDGTRLLENLYLYDCLRTDRVMSAWGLEVRVPFLQRKLVQFVLSLDPEYRMCNEKPFNGLDRHMGKMLLRSMIHQYRLLPEQITFRPKEAFSDAVSSQDELWYQSIQKWIEPYSFDTVSFNGLQPISKESRYYREVFDCLFPGQSHILKEYWMPQWSTQVDPSATVLECYTASFKVSEK